MTKIKIPDMIRSNLFNISDLQVKFQNSEHPKPVRIIEWIVFKTICRRFNQIDQSSIFTTLQD